MDKPQPIRLTREQLRKFLPTPDLVRAFEEYIRLLADLTPDQINQLILLNQLAQDAAESAQFAASTATAIAHAALAAAVEYRDGAGPAQLASIAAQLHALDRRVAAIEERPT